MAGGPYSAQIQRALAGFAASPTFTGDVNITGTLTATGNVFAGAAGVVGWTGLSRLTSPSNGVVLLTNALGTDFSRLQFGGTTNAFPSLKRSGAGLEARLADDSNSATFKASSLTVNPSLGLVFESNSFVSSAGVGLLRFARADGSTGVRLDVTVDGTARFLAVGGGDTAIVRMSQATVNGKVVLDGTTTSTGAGAVGITGSIHEVTTTGTGDALTLANGTEGQRLTVVYVAEGAGTDTAVLTPTNFGSGATITFATLGQSVKLIFTNSKWYVDGAAFGAVVA